MKNDIKVIGVNYPKVGEIFYWKDEDGVMHDNICLKIEKYPEGNVETNYFIYLSPNGSGSFVDETCIVDPLSMEIEIYKKKKFKQKIKEIADLFKQDEFKEIISVAYKKRYGKEGGIEMLKEIVDFLGNEENYE